MQRRFGGAQPLRVIEPIVGTTSQPLGAVVDIEQDCIVGGATGPNKRAHVRFTDPDTLIHKAAAEKFGYLSASPCHDLGDQFGDGDPSIGAKLAKRGAE